MITDPHNITPQQEKELIELIECEETRGMPSRHITNLHGVNLRDVLTRLESEGKLASVSTGQRRLGRRWFTPEHFQQSVYA